LNGLTHSESSFLKTEVYLQETRKNTARTQTGRVENVDESTRLDSSQDDSTSLKLTHLTGSDREGRNVEESIRIDTTRQKLICRTQREGKQRR